MKSDFQTRKMLSTSDRQNAELRSHLAIAERQVRDLSLALEKSRKERQALEAELKSYRSTGVRA